MGCHMEVKLPDPFRVRFIYCEQRLRQSDQQERSLSNVHVLSRINPHRQQCSKVARAEDEICRRRARRKQG